MSYTKLLNRNHSSVNQSIALIDCNNFYASCERIFNPKLIGKPIVVLSNNDGCIIARSKEAKKLGIKMLNQQESRNFSTFLSMVYEIFIS